MGAENIITGVLETGGERLDKALSAASGLSRERVKALIGEGRVSLAGKAASSASAKPAAGTAWSIDVPPAVEAKARP